MSAFLSWTVPAFADDPAGIRHMMMATFDKPELPLTVEPVTVLGDVAVDHRRHGRTSLVTGCAT
ncbi:MAG TPA: hypothetical protein VMF90_08635 [Rhizobiaceae bacterium]|nr:hypothetical protein [Rhizobiaceae bacterium]